MNILYLHAHDAGRYLQPYGYPVSTPNLQQLAESSMVFRNAHAAAPTCSPSRAALLTGRSPHAAGMCGLAHRGFRLLQAEQHLASFLEEQGWQTVLTGIQHLHCGEAPGSPYTLQKHADSADGWTAHDSEVADHACAFLSEAHRSQALDDEAGPAEEGPAPFFLDCGFWYPHRPFPEIDDLQQAQNAADFVMPPEGSIDNAETRDDTARFHQALRHMDRCVGRVLDELAAGPCAENTLVLFTIDHGIAFPGHKCQLNDRGTGVALMLKTPGRAVGVNDSLVSHLDVFPTICDLAGLTPPQWLEGVSLRSLLEGDSEPREVRDEVFAEVSYHAGYEPKRSVRTRHYRLVRRFDDDLRPVPANVDASPAKRALIDAGWLESECEEIELYDLRVDPGEKHNRADDPAMATVRADLEARLVAWMRRTEDPLLAGQVVAPPGAVVDPREQVEPS